MDDLVVLTPTPIAEQRKSAAALVGVVVASYLFRLPPLLNARSTNSDAAVVGLQAIHILRGEHSAFLWGSGYQTSADAYVAALFFVLAGRTPYALMLSALTLHVVSTVLVFALMRRRFGALSSALLTLPLVFTPSSVHSYALYPPRQLSLTLAIAALFTLDRAALERSSARPLWLAGGGVLYGLAVSADPYPMVLAPIILGYGLLVAVEKPARTLPALAFGTLFGLVPFVWLHRTGATGQMGLTMNVVGHNWDLLVRECLPWALSYKVYFARNVMDYMPWDAPPIVRGIQIAGAIAVGVIVAIGLGAIFVKRIAWPTRRLAFVGAMTYPVVIGAFLASVMVMDHFSMRYLATLTLMLPIAAMAAAELLGTARVAVLLAPHLLAAALGGWIGYGPFIDRSGLPVRETPELADDGALENVLRERGVKYAIADYWTSYRLTLLWGERIIVIPTNAREDRYPPYRQAVEAAPVFAYIYDPGRSRENPAAIETELAAENARVDKTQVGKLIAFVCVRR